MKLLPLILAFIVFASSVHPCEGVLMRQHAQTAEARVCAAAEESHSCCKPPADGDAAPTKTDSCKGYLCYCCIVVITSMADIPSFFFRVEVEQQSLWQASVATYDFTPVIWQPPQAA